jgi:hypothetical protein
MNPLLQILARRNDDEGIGRIIGPLALLLIWMVGGALSAWAKKRQQQKKTPPRVVVRTQTQPTRQTQPSRRPPVIRPGPVAIRKVQPPRPPTRLPQPPRRPTLDDLRVGAGSLPARPGKSGKPTRPAKVAVEAEEDDESVVHSTMTEIGSKQFATAQENRTRIMEARNERLRGLLRGGAIQDQIVADELLSPPLALRENPIY